LSSSTIHISILIVSFNVKDCLRTLIQSIRASAFATQKYEVIVVDNASTDGTVEWLKNEAPDVTVIENDQNRGFGAANNQAAEIAQGDYLFFLNPDTKLQPDSLDTMLQYLEEKPKLIGCGCQIQDPGGTIAPESKRRFPSVRNVTSKIFSSDRLQGWPVNTSYYDWDSLNQNSEAEVLSGCCLLLEKAVFEEIGGFDEQFFLFGEDVDLCKRLHAAGYRLGYTADTHITHLKGQSTRQNEARYLWHFYKSAYLYAVKHHRRSQSPSFKLFIASGALIHGLAKFLQHKIKQSKKLALRLFM
jgi:GT2 family glycosyltransferase